MALPLIPTEHLYVEDFQNEKHVLRCAVLHAFRGDVLDCTC